MITTRCDKASMLEWRNAVLAAPPNQEKMRSFLARVAECGKSLKAQESDLKRMYDDMRERYIEQFGFCKAGFPWEEQIKHING